MLSEYNLSCNVNLRGLTFAGEEDWLEQRKHCIGGSDVGALLGLNKYSSPYKVFKSKTSPTFKSEDSVYTRKGKCLEPVIRKNFVTPYMLKQDYTVKEVPYILKNNKFPWIHANLDSIAIPNLPVGKPSENIIIEIKWVSEYAEVNWYSEDYCGVPASYYAQVQTYMLVTGASKAIICALFDRTWEMHYFEIPADREMQVQIYNTTKKFYDNNLMAGMAPPIVPSLDKEDFIEALKKEVPTYKTSEMDLLLAAYKENHAKITELTKTETGYKDQINELYAKGARPKDSIIKVSVSLRSSTTFDTATFKEAHSELYNQYIKKNEYSVTLIK